MDRAEAICYLSPIAESATLPRYKEALDTAIAALREQEQREQKPITNADRIRAISDEELAEFLVHFSNGVKRWLQQPAGGADHE